MKGYKMYTQIKHLKDKGFTRHWVAKQLGIHRKTVSRYWDMPVDEYEENLHCIRACEEKSVKKEPSVIK